MEDGQVSKAYIASPDLSQTYLTPTTCTNDFTELPKMIAATWSRRTKATSKEYFIQLMGTSEIIREITG